ncbi:hypothetical protein BGZ68_006078 [Mortierella alpina]|nr:hypothetical protein BGZ68_006078 [Mortierella alpina]
MPANCSHLGLGLTGPLVLNVLTAPADRIRLFLQTQDEIILNLREESLAHHSTHASPPATTPTSRKHSYISSDNNINNNLHQVDDQDNLDHKSINDEDEEEDDNTPRSIIVPYAQLPYTDMQDCFCRLVEKEGQRSLWRGYSAECARLLVQAGIERGLRRRHLLDIRTWLSIPGPADVASLSFGGSVAWILGSAVEGTLMSAVALAVVYPLATVQTKMATDVIRRTRQRPRKIQSSPSSPAPSLDEDDSNSNSNNNGSSIPEVESCSKPYETDTNSSTAGSGPGSIVLLPSESESSPRDSVEWFEHAEEEEVVKENIDQEDKEVEHKEGSVLYTTKTTLQEKNDYYYTLSYKYNHHKDAFQSTVASEGYLGLYKGFSTVLVSTFVSRFATLSLIRLLTATVLRSSGTSSSSSSGMRGVLAGVGAYVVMWGAASVVNLIVYPLSTICHRRMIARPGRYTSSWDAGKQIVEKQGWKALYKGVDVAMLKGVVLVVLSKIF